MKQKVEHDCACGCGGKSSTGAAFLRGHWAKTQKARQSQSDRICGSKNPFSRFPALAQEQSERMMGNHFCDSVATSERMKLNNPMFDAGVRERVGSAHKGKFVPTGSNSCHWTGKNDSYRGPDWLKQRQNVLSRDGFCCRRCDRRTALTVHHKVKSYDGIIWDNRLENLITLCRVCHGKEHHPFKKEKKVD